MQAGPATVEWTDVVGAFGPFVAAATALWIAFRATRRERSRRPKLTVHFDASGREDFVIGARDSEGRERHWVRLRVANAIGKRTAENVEILFLDLRSNNPADAIVRTMPVSGRAFRWTHHDHPDGKPVTKMDIAPGASRHFDLLRLAEPFVGPVNPGQTGALVGLLLYPPTDPLRYALAAGKYQALIVITARDTDATYYSIEVEFDGLWWSAADVGKHLQIRPVQIDRPRSSRDVVPRMRTRLWHRIKRS